MRGKKQGRGLGLILFLLEAHNQTTRLVLTSKNQGEPHTKETDTNQLTHDALGTNAATRAGLAPLADGLSLLAES